MTAFLVAAKPQTFQKTEFVKAEKVIDGIRISFETPRHIGYSRSLWSYDSPDKRNGTSARLALEAIDSRILIPLSYVFQTYLIFNVDPVSRRELVNSRPPIRPLK
ncbi:MAG: hypothetical protein ABWY78_19870, partial [Microvirga sp.]